VGAVHINVSADVARVNIFCYDRRRMKRAKAPQRSRPSYHHGNLHAALLEAASRLVAEKGPAGFTLREVARRAGVSHNAPYRHFRDKSDLLATMAAIGFRELTQAMLAAAEPQPTSLERFKHSGLAYVTFALRRPEHFCVMFDAPIPELEYPECADAGHECFRTLERFVESCQRDGAFADEDPKMRALGAWSIVHGIAKLAIAGRLPFSSDVEVLQFVALAIDRSFP
jgi:AcrR family transcriptional regulator